jgi:hypothetical protein
MRSVHLCNKVDHTAQKRKGAMSSCSCCIQVQAEAYADTTQDATGRSHMEVRLYSEVEVSYLALLALSCMQRKASAALNSPTACQNQSSLGINTITQIIIVPGEVGHNTPQPFLQKPLHTSRCVVVCCRALPLLNPYLLKFSAQHLYAMADAAAGAWNSIAFKPLIS